MGLLPAGHGSDTIWNMSMLHLCSAQHPFATPRLAFKAARILALAESTGLWRAGEPVVELDAQTFGAAIEAITKAGVASKAVFELSMGMGAAPDRLDRVLDRVYEELHA